jgi:hypothetical protein
LETCRAHSQQYDRRYEFENADCAHEVRKATVRCGKEKERSESDPQANRHWESSENGPASEQIGQLAWSANAKQPDCSDRNSG